MFHVVYSRHYECEIGPHVFPTEKFRLTVERLVSEGRMTPQQILEPEPASRADLERVHTAEYLDEFLALRPTARVLRSELPITAPIRDAYLLATGGTILAARRALEEGSVMHVGGGYHHAMPGHAEGFCYVNDVAVAIRVLQHEGRLQRAAVIDTDLHQGNGTARIFQGDASVFTFSIHQENNYPVKEKSDWDIGLPDGLGDEAYLEKLATAVPQILRTQRPQLVMMVAGADPYRDDLLGGLRLSLEGLRQRDALVVQACGALGIPVVGLTAGGYARDLQDTVTIHAQTALELMAWKREAP